MEMIIVTGAGRTPAALADAEPVYSGKTGYSPNEIDDWWQEAADHAVDLGLEEAEAWVLEIPAAGISDDSESALDAELSVACFYQRSIQR